MSAREPGLGSASVGEASGDKASAPDALDDWLSKVGMGDRGAFDDVYTAMAGPVYGVATRVLGDAALAEEVAQDVLIEVWRTAARFDPARGSARAWVLTMAHRRAVDRVRLEQAAQARETRIASRESDSAMFDEVAESVEARLEQQRVRHCLAGLTALQRESLTLAYYDGYTYSQVAGRLGVPLGTIKTRMRDGLAKLRDCLGVSR